MANQFTEIQNIADEELLAASGGIFFLAPIIGTAVGIGKGLEQVVSESNEKASLPWGQGWSRG